MTTKAISYTVYKFMYHVGFIYYHNNASEKQRNKITSYLQITHAPNALNV